MKNYSLSLLCIFLSMPLYASEPRIAECTLQEQEETADPKITITQDDEPATYSLTLEQIQQVANLAAERACTSLKQKNEKLKANHLKLLSRGIPLAAFLGFVATGEGRAKVFENLTNNQEMLRGKIIPAYLDKMHTFGHAKVLAAKSLHGFRFQITTQQLAEICYNTLNASEMSLEISKEQLARLVATQATTSLLKRSIQCDSNDIVCSLPNNIIILRKNQLLKSGCHTAIDIAEHIAENRPVTPKNASIHALKYISAEVAYNLLVQTMHTAAKKTGTSSPTLETLLPEDCNPQSEHAVITKCLICNGLIYSPQIARAVAASAQATAQWTMNIIAEHCLPFHNIEIRF